MQRYWLGDSKRAKESQVTELGSFVNGSSRHTLAPWLDAQDPDNRQQASVGTATVAMMLNGSGAKR